MTLIDEVAAARKSIFRDGYDISFGELVSLYDKGELIVQPEYQRLFRWDATQKTRFIESILLNIPFPSIFVFADAKGRWELVDGLQRVSTTLEFMGKLRNAEGEIVGPFVCDGTGLIPALENSRWPTPAEEKLPEDELPDDVLPLSLQLSIRRARVRVEILRQDTDAHIKYELFQRLNSGGAKLTEQELRNCIIVSINKTAFENLKAMAESPKLSQMTHFGEERIKQQYLTELVVRFLVLRNFPYSNGLDVHEYLDKGMVQISENKIFPWGKEVALFYKTLDKLVSAVGKEAYEKNNRFSLAMYEFVMLGLSRAIETNEAAVTDELVKERVASVLKLAQADQYSGTGVRGTDRLSKFVTPLAPDFFLQK
jgi:hypothetical protein